MASLLPKINDKHLRIIACAGSGKTTTIAGKVAYLLDPTNGYDLKPENIMINPDNLHIKIIDFGLSSYYSDLKQLTKN